jgi:hypothetical protein
VFDVYGQSPWVVGSALGSILGNMQILGLTLFCTGVFGIFLHMYNMLSQICAVPKIDALEAFCNLFLDDVFMGSRPTKNFSNILHRLDGAHPYIAGVSVASSLSGRATRDESFL